MEQENILNSKNNKIFIIIAGVVEFVANVVGIITTFTVSKTIGITIIVIAIIVSILVSSFFAINFFRAKKAINIYKRTSEKLQYETLSEFHHIIHDIRDNSFYILGCKERLDKTFKKIEISLCTRIEKMLSNIFNQRTNVCIKLISGNNVLDIPNHKNKDWKLYTVARGENSIGRDRSDGVPISIGENSDFKIILEGKVDYFKSPDMRNIRNDFYNDYGIPYNNSRDSQTRKFSDFYNSTIVIPIRISEENINIDGYDIENQNNSYHILGFLCVDTLEPFTTPDELVKFNLGVEYAKAIADAMYYQIFCYFSQRFELCEEAILERDMGEMNVQEIM